MVTNLGPRQKAWVAALRSGDYKQGRYVLHNVKEGTRCCLGVAFDVCKKLGLELESVFRDRQGLKVEQWGTSYAILNKEVMDYLKIRNVFGAFGGTTLTSLNDNEHKTFAEIADLIEQHASEIFTEPV